MKNALQIENHIIGKIEVIESSIKIESKEVKAERRDLILKDKYINSQFILLRNLKGFIMPLKNEYYFLITQKAFNAFTFIPHILQTEKIISIHISTYNLSKRVALAIGEYLELDVIHKAHIILNKLMKYDHDEIIQLLKRYESKKLLSWSMAQNHSKINCIKTEANYYIISGSGNFSSNANTEQYTIFNNKLIYNKSIKYLENL